ncbi:unnamed protein product [Scytosiphon promiscuus]
MGDRRVLPARSRSASVPRGTIGRRGPRQQSHDADPFGSNSGRHGVPPLSSSSQQQQEGGADEGDWQEPRGSPSLSRRSSFGEMSGRGRGRGGHPSGVGANEIGRVSAVTRTVSSGALRIGGARGAGTGGGRSLNSGDGHTPYGNDDFREGGDADDFDGDGDEEGYDSDTMSVMDSDAMRAAMGRRGVGDRAGAMGGRVGAGGTVEYVVEFERAKKLGMLLERHDEWPDGREQRSERAIVKMVVDSGPAQIRGVTVGSKVKRVNGEPVEGLTYQETLERIKQASRPLRVHFERGQLQQEDNVGQILFKKTIRVPRSFSAWQPRYFVLGGAVAKVHVLQIYVSKQSYDRMVLAVFENRRISERVKAYKLNNLYKCGPIKMKAYKGRPAPLYFFTVKLPTSRLKQLNFASQTLDDLQHLRNSMIKFTSK